jgi:hypothetical protein
MARVDTLSFTGDKGTPSGGGTFYTSIVTWEAAAQAAFDVTEPYTLECFGDFVGGLNETVTIDGWTQPTPTNNLTIKAAAGEEHNGVLGAGFYLFYDTGFDIVMNVYIDNVTIQDIGFKLNSTQFSSFFGLNSTNLLIERCWAWHTTTVSSARVGFDFLDTVNLVCRNCLALYPGFAGFRTRGATNAVLENCTAIGSSLTNSGEGYASDNNQTTLINCAAYNHFVNQWSGTYNAASDSNIGQFAPPGTNAVSGLGAADFVNFTEDGTTVDANPAPGGLLDGANNPGADLSGTFTDDITGGTRTLPWERGAYDIIAGGVTFDGPDIVAQTGTENQVFTFDENGEGTVASRFTGATGYAVSPDSSPLPAGLTVNATTGNIEGTPTESGTFSNIIIRGSE